MNSWSTKLIKSVQLESPSLETEKILNLIIIPFPVYIWSIELVAQFIVTVPRRPLIEIQEWLAQQLGCFSGISIPILIDDRKS